MFVWGLSEGGGGRGEGATPGVNNKAVAYIGGGGVQSGKGTLRLKWTAGRHNTRSNTILRTRCIAVMTPTYMWCDRGHVCCWEVSVRDPAVVPCVKAAHATNVNHEHGRTQHMARTVRRDLHNRQRQKKLDRS